MILLRSTDANQDGGTSSTPPDASAGPSPETTAAPPRAELDAKLAEIMKAHEPPEKKEEPEEPKEPVAPEAPPEEPPKAPEEEPEKVPFHKHPRWIEQQEKLAKANGELEQAKPNIERIQRIDEYCQRFGITGEQFSQALEMAALLNGDPVEARNRLAPVWESLGRYTGDKLPADLDQEVKDGLLTEARAKEIAALRAQQEVAGKRQKMSQEQAAQQAYTNMVESVTQWEQSKMVTDPDYKSKADEVADRFAFLRLRTPPKSAPEAIALAEQALADVNKRRSSAPKVPVGRQGLNGVVKRAAAPPKSPLEAAERAMEKYKV